jgi:hypothetical protein
MPAICFLGGRVDLRFEARDAFCHIITYFHVGQILSDVQSTELNLQSKIQYSEVAARVRCIALHLLRTGLMNECDRSCN